VSKEAHDDAKVRMTQGQRGPHDRLRDRPSHSRRRAATRLPVCSCSGLKEDISHGRP
jgi:hypothetical protein